MFKTMNKPNLKQICDRLNQLNDFYTKEVVEWVLSAHTDQLLCDTEWELRDHLLNILNTYHPDIVMEGFEIMYPETVQFFKMKKVG